MQTWQRITIVVGIVCAVIGLALALTNVDTSGTQCGNALSPKSHTGSFSDEGSIYQAELDKAACADTIGSRRLTAGLIGGIGVVAVIVAVVPRRTQELTETS